MWAAVWRWLSLNGCSALFLDCAESTIELCADASQRMGMSCSLKKEPVRLDGRGDGSCLRMGDVASEVRAKFWFFALRTRVVFGLGWSSTNTMREGLDDFVWW